MDTSKFRALLTTLMLVFTMSVGFSGCSSTEETEDTGSSDECPAGGPRGDNGVCCDVDPVQEGCPGM